MAKRRKKKYSWIVPALLLLVAAAAGLFAVIALRGRQDHTENPDGSLIGSFPLPVPSSNTVPAPETALESFSPAGPALQPRTEAGASLLAVWEQTRACENVGSPLTEGDTAELTLHVTTLDTARLTEAMTAALEPELERLVREFPSVWEVYEEDGLVRRDLLRQCFAETLPAVASEGSFGSVQDFTLRLSYADGAWRIDNRDELDALLLGELSDADAAAEAMMDEISLALIYIPKHYTLEESVLVAPAPDPARFGESKDTTDLEALLMTPEARRLIDGRELVWNPEIERFPGSSVYWYFDETILCIVWQEIVGHSEGTFSEIIVADGSQIRRRISGDEPFSYDFHTTSEFARSSNAVLCLGSDLYFHHRSIGIVVYQREMIRFEPVRCDCCYITSDGDMLFSYHRQFETQEEAQRFIEENDVVFSVCFGPVLIDDGVDVTPLSYPWGEINQNYARSALGLIDPHHYLAMNINGAPGTDYRFLATLRQAADAMIAHGCVKAYALDGGQTATTVFGGTLINPVQFGEEKPISDVIYFCTAIPDDGSGG